MKITLTHWTPSTIETAKCRSSYSGTPTPVKQPTQEVTRLDVEIFKAGGISRFVFWTEDGKSEALILSKTDNVQMSRNANKKNEPLVTADGKEKEEFT